MTEMPWSLAFLMTVAADGESRLTIIRTLTPLVDHLVGDRGELGLVAVGVLDVVLDAGGVERLTEELAVGRLPAGRGRGVGQDHADLALRLLAAPAVRQPPPPPLSSPPQAPTTRATASIATRAKMRFNMK